MSSRDLRSPAGTSTVKVDEPSESPTRNSLTNILSKTRRRRPKNQDSAAGSIASTGTESDSHGIRESLENAIEKLKAHNGIDEDGEAHGIKKLAAKGIGSKRRRKKQEQEDEERASEEAARGRTVAERGTLENDSRRSFSRNWSGDGSSLLTYDSETESTIETPPPLLSRPSHSGYLTTSSPLIHSATLPITASLVGAQFDGVPTPRAATFSTDSDKLAASESSTSVISNTLQAPYDGSQKRSPSPVGRLKEALRPGRKGSSQQSSPERKAGGRTDTLQLEKENSISDGRRGSVASRIGAIFPDRQTQQSVSATASPERPKTAKVQAIDTNAPPQTPPASESVAPIIVNTPPTPTDPSAPRFESRRDRGTSDPVTTNPNVVTSPSGNMISHRRVRSGSATLGPSKLSNITSVPLTPTPENGGSTPTPSQSGFFGSVFSAAQNAANTLTTSISNTSLVPGGKKEHKTAPQELKEVEDPEVETLGDNLDSEKEPEEKELAVKTLGMGDLSLSHLGISEATSESNTPVSAKFPEEARGRSETKVEDGIIGRAMASAVNGALETDSPTTVEDNVRPRSVLEGSNGGAETPPNGSVFEGKLGIQRSGSIRSAVGRRRKRGSSAATGTTIGAAIAAANASVAQPNAQGSTPKITGFAVASKKRNRDFHALFRSVPDDDYLIEDYSCALQREILAHGRLYVSEGHLCFSSNIFGWVTTLVMSFDEIVAVEKRSTALLFKNGLMISTLHAKNVFASFTSRDSTYDLIVGIWKLGHPSLRSSLNGVRIDETGGDKTEKDDGQNPPSRSGSDTDSDGEEGDDIYDEDDDRDSMSFTQAEGSVAGSDIAEKPIARKPSAIIVPANGDGTPSEKKEGAPAAPKDNFPGPATHAPTECSDGDTHYAKVIADDVIPAPLGKVYDLMFGPASVTWIKNFLTVEQKSLELAMPEDKKPLGVDNKVRVYSYIKPLPGSIGPRQTKCISTETLDSLDLEKAVSVTISTQTPDVPSGNVFSTKTKYCLTWAEGNMTRLQMNCNVEWTGKSWLKGPIEKGANDGQVQYAKDIVAALKATVSSRRPTITTTTKKGKKGRKSRKDTGVSKSTDGASDTKPTVENWGLFEPVRPILGPLFDILKPLVTGNMMFGLLVGLLVASWFGFGLLGSGGRVDVGWVGTPERIAAYEEIWRREESELWDWLEDRVGMDRVRESSQMGVESRVVKEKLKGERMGVREREEAIRVTEEKLRVLKGVVERERKGRGGLRDVAADKKEPLEGVKQELKRAEEKVEEVVELE